MKAESSMSVRRSSFILHPLLSHLWLHEPDAAAIARANRELGLPSAEPAELAQAYADIFLLNLPPYGTVFTDAYGELNGPDAQRAAALYEAHGYRPPELTSVGAPDHLGLCLGFLAWCEEKRLETITPEAKWSGVRDFVSSLLSWAPLCCQAVEREPSAHPFYRTLAMRTCEWLMAGRRWLIGGDEAPYAPSPMLHFSNLSSDDEVSLRSLLHFFLTPMRCGVYLSRSRWGQMALDLGRRLPFGSRFEVAEMLFASAGEAGQIEPLLTLLEAEVEAWAAEYRALAEKYPAWRPNAETWLARTAGATRTLSEMRELALTFSS